MNSNEGRRWAVIAIIWALGLLILGWNIAAVDDLRMVMITDAMERSERRFLQQNTTEIELTSLAKERLEQKTPSIKLGILSINQYLEKKAKAHGLSNAKFTLKEILDNQSKAIILLACDGNYTQLISLLNELESLMPYLTAHHLKASAMPGNHVMRFFMTFQYEGRVEDAIPAPELTSSGGILPNSKL